MSRRQIGFVTSLVRPQVVALACVLAIAGCASGPEHPSLNDAQLPRLLPVRNFVANTDHNAAYRLSPDGKRLAWIGVSRLRSAIQWRELDGENTATVHSKRFAKEAPRPMWAADGHTVLYHHDPSGRENHHVFAIDTLSPGAPARELTPYPDVKAFVLHVPSKPSNRVYIMHNRRDRALFDLYAVDVTTGEETLLQENPESIIYTMVDDDGVIRVRVRQTDEARYLEVPTGAKSGEPWNILREASRFDSIWPIGLSADGKHLSLLSNIGRDKTVFSQLTLATGEETVLYEHPEVDVQGVVLSPRDRRPLVAYTRAGYPAAYYFDKRLGKRFEALQLRSPAGVNITSLTRDERWATAVVYDDRGATFHLLDLDAAEQEQIGATSSHRRREHFVPSRPFAFSASDGMTINAQITLPRVEVQRSLPTVVLVHGGPWSRDHWQYHTTVQFLANRGYAVLQVNYRGSTGFGRAYTEAAEGEFADAMHRDLIDGLGWAVDQGITDPQKVAIMGRSFGGYATLVGMTMTPGEFACGVDIVGVSDLATLLEDAPPYWRNSMHYWHRYAGDPATPEGRKLLDERSPLNYAAQAEGPLLVVHGRNDPRVNVDQSDRMVAALRAADKPVDYMVIDGEGHGFGHWKNQLRIYRAVEDFLASCIDGRSSGFDFYQLGSWAF